MLAAETNGVGPSFSEHPTPPHAGSSQSPALGERGVEMVGLRPAAGGPLGWLGARGAQAAEWLPPAL